MHVFLLFIESQYNFPELWKCLIPSPFLSLKSRMLLKIVDRATAFFLNCLFCSLQVLSMACPKPELEDE